MRVINSFNQSALYSVFNAMRDVHQAVDWFAGLSPNNHQTDEVKSLLDARDRKKETMFETVYPNHKALYEAHWGSPGNEQELATIES
ncbi:hypothetical protein SAMD00023353_0301340 [Rosellinia necatrix]|uniref:Uncharacterized protein n=1 Tax=Rosellinia necatrix TaxID=77044 RepID=A0A1S8A589_ROSNE|nr:hypothetical protein SAMD00023353_0301340 [Rosellinia necatrix]